MSLLHYRITSYHRRLQPRETIILQAESETTLPTQVTLFGFM